MIEPARLLAFAFAGADLLFEIDRGGRILFATGAINGLAKTATITGELGAELFHEDDRARFSMMAHGLAPGDRVGPLPVTLASGDKATLSMCFLPQNDRISCALARNGQREPLLGGTDFETGLPDRKAFALAADEKAGTNSAMALVNVTNLGEVCATLPPEAAANLMAAIGSNLRDIEGGIAARVSPTGFGLVAESRDSASQLVERIQTPAREQGITSFAIEQVLMSLKARSLTPEQSILALRHVIERFAAGNHKQIVGADLAQAFEQMMDETMERAQLFCTTVAEGSFDLVFEPIVELNTGAISHFEVLSRFRSGHSPADTILFAEDLDLADSFDLALVVKAFNLLDPQYDGPSIAINLSGRSFCNPSSFLKLSTLLSRNRALAKRVLIEITETVELSDVAAADRAIQLLRKMGYRVGIDDFGSGAASLQYLHGLSVDFVKLDGSLIERLGKSPREDALVRSVLASCGELEVETIAEWIDSPEKLKRCTEIGVRFGQGRQFGAPLVALPVSPKPRSVQPRRHMQ